MGLFSWLRGGNGDEEAKVTPARAEPAPNPSRRGVELVAAGRYAEACDAFRQAIASEPEIAAHYVNLAFAFQESGDGPSATVSLRRAIALDPESFDAQFMLAASLERADDLAGAEVCLLRAVALDPTFEQAHADLCRIQGQQGDSAGARRSVDAALARFPDSELLHVASGNLFMGAGEIDAALSSFDRVLAARPGDINMRLNRALALHAARRYDEAFAEYGVALATGVASAKAYLGRANVLSDRGETEQAIEDYRNALALAPDESEWHNLLGTALQHIGRTSEAIDCYREAIRLRPDLPRAYANQGLALVEIGDVPGAVAIYRKGLAAKPIAEMHDNLACALQKMGFIDEALHHFEEALKLRPDNLSTRCNLAAALSDAGSPTLAIEEYRNILAADPAHLAAHGNLLFSLSTHESTSTDAYLEEARRYDAKVSPPFPAVMRPSLRAVGTPLRLGFVSGDLRNHPVGYFLEGILCHLDRRRFELVAYPTVIREDALTSRIRPLFSGWRSLRGMTNEQAVSAIRADGIDILFDLAGHTGDSRLPVFAARAAPVQVAWLGFFASTGIAAMDYIFADEVCVPPGSERQFTERVWRLPQTRLCFTAPAPGTTPDVSPLPASASGYVTFGCLQRFPKINTAVLELWGKIFAAIPTARLFFQSPQTGRQIYIDQMLQRLRQVGIAPGRVTTRPPVPRKLYLRAYDEVDIVLDTFPFNGGTTTCEALWMGVPTLTLEGATMISRQGMTMMRAAGLDDWVAANVPQFVDLAARHASNLSELARIRASLRARAMVSPLFDVQLFAQRFGRAVEELWEVTSGAPRPEVGHNLSP